jgi:hypothetical protein
MYYRIAVQTYAPPTLRWQSDPLCSLPAVAQWLMHVRIFPPERLSVFSSDWPEGLDEQLRLANEGMESFSVPATRFLPERTSVLPVRAPVALLPPAAEAGHAATAQPASCYQPLLISPMEQRRDALERGAGGDHDQPYRFSMLASTPEMLAWVRLLARVHHGDLRAEVVV